MPHHDSPCGMPDPLVEAGLLPLGDTPYDEQLRIREDRVRQALRRGGLTVEVAPIVPSPRQEGYRARVRLHGEAGGRLAFHKEGTHDRVMGDLGRLARPELMAAASALEAAGGVRGAVELRTDGERVVTVLEAPASPAPRLPGNVAVGNRRLYGDVRLRVGGLRVSPGSFFQVNLELNARIRADLAERVAALAPARLLDLYGGVGNLSATPAARGTPVTLIESTLAAVEDARVNLVGAEVKKGDAGRFRAGDTFFDVVVLDPPRAGAPGVLAELQITRPRAIYYLSCEPVTLARDLATLAGRGYRLTSVQPYDLFPGTLHVETLAVLTRA